MSHQSLEERLQSGKLLLMDGATGTELQRRGFQLESPGWSASAIRERPDLLEQIHRDYFEAGAELVTANTFRTHQRSLSETRWKAESRVLTLEAVEIARRAVNNRAYLAGSIAPLEDCYSPQLTPSESELFTEHKEIARNLADAGVDLILVETQITIREAVLAASAAASVNVPFAVSFTTNGKGQLLSGEPLADAMREVIAVKPLAILVNCVPCDEVLSNLEVMFESYPDVVLGAYANTGRLRTDGTWELTAGGNPAVYAEFMQRWKEFGIQLVGGCCGTGPAHVEALYKRVYGNESA